MSETQGRGPYTDEGRVNVAAKIAHENGGGDSAITAATRQAGISDTSKNMIEQVRRKMIELFGR